MVARPDFAAKKIWNASAPIIGTIGETYLRSLGIDRPQREPLRFNSFPYGEGAELPCIIAKVEASNGRFVGIESHYLEQDGRAKTDALEGVRVLGPVRGGTIRFSKYPRSPFITICQNLEDGLALFHRAQLECVWVAPYGTMPSDIDIPNYAHRVTIAFRDNLLGRHFAELAQTSLRRRRLNTDLLPLKELSGRRPSVDTGYEGV